MRRAIIMADFGRKTGIGHLMRCGTLSGELAKHFDVSFVCENNEYVSFVEKHAHSHDASLITLDDLSKIGTEIEADVIIIDSYSATSMFLTSIKNLYELTAVIDDNALLSYYDADVVINQNIGAEIYAYNCRRDTTLLLGPHYLMLRDAFRDTNPIDIDSMVENIVITMGGADCNNTTEKILKLVQDETRYTYNVVVGSGFHNVNRLCELSETNPRIVLHFNTDMPELFRNCQAAIAACGSTIYELSVMGVPTIGVVTADNQKNASIAMENEGVILSAGLEEKLSRDYFLELFKDITTDKELREDMHNTQINAVARNGAQNIVKELLQRVK